MRHEEIQRIYKNHYFLSFKDMGGVKQLTGNVDVLVFFVSDVRSKWTDSAKKKYRAVQKDGKGRYFSNDKLAYLAFFQKNYHTGNWRLPIRYYAQEAIREAIEGYYDNSLKRTHSIIENHQSFFNSLKDVKKIVILGHSLSEVDMPYFDKIADSIMKDRVEWEISYHTQEDINRIYHFCKRYGISAHTTLL